MQRSIKEKKSSWCMIYTAVIYWLVCLFQNRFCEYGRADEASQICRGEAIFVQAGSYCTLFPRWQHDGDCQPRLFDFDMGQQQPPRGHIRAGVLSVPRRFSLNSVPIRVSGLGVQRSLPLLHRGPQWVSHRCLRDEKDMQDLHVCFAARPHL